MAGRRSQVAAVLRTAKKYTAHGLGRRVLSSMGFYSFCPGKPVYEIGRPLFDKVTIHLDNGKDFVIRAENNSIENKYVRSMKLNGRELEEPRFSHFDLMKGGELVLEMEK